GRGHPDRGPRGPARGGASRHRHPMDRPRSRLAHRAPGCGRLRRKEPHMPKATPDTDPGLSATELAIVARLFERLAERDNQMWERVIARDSATQGGLLEL